MYCVPEMKNGTAIRSREGKGNFYMAKYAKCPRCELNYVDTEKQQFCDVCLKEMKGVEDETFLLDEEEDGLMELCPKCGENMMHVGEEMCEECRKKLSDEDERDLDDEIDDDEEWRSYIDDDTDEEDDVGLDKELAEELEEEFNAEEEAEDDFEEESEEAEDDFEYVSADDYDPDEDDEDEDGSDSDDDDF